MSFKNKVTFILIMCSVLFYSMLFSVDALSEKEIAIDKFYSYDQKLLCISHRGDTREHPENSLAAVKSALKSGADFVSVSVDKTADGIFFLCENESLGNICDAPYENLSQMNSAEVDNYRLFDIYGNLTKHKLTSLEKFLKNTYSDDGIILDVKAEDKDAVYNVLSENGALYRVILRVRENPSKLINWAESKTEKVYVIGVYGGNIIFNTISAINKITYADMPAVQFESKNYFNVAYGEFFTKRYITAVNPRAVAATYSSDLCGQRGDSSDGWNELIGKGYSVIETNNIEAFVAYRKETERLGVAVAELVDRVFYVDRGMYSDISISNLEKATLYGKTLVSGEVVFSLDEVQKAYSQLIYALGEMKISSGEVDTRGALNITVGKIVATVIVGAALLVGQIYVYKMRKKKEKI